MCAVFTGVYYECDLVVFILLNVFICHQCINVGFHLIHISGRTPVANQICYCRCYIAAAAAVSARVDNKLGSGAAQ